MFQPSKIMNAKDRDWIERGLKVMYAPEPLDRLLHRIAIGEYHAIRLESGIIILRLLECGEERELNVYLLSGRGVLKELRDIISKLRAVAEFFGCKWISGLAIRPGLQRAYRQAGAKDAGAYMLMEV